MDCPFCRKLQDLSAFGEGELVWQFPGSVAFLGPWQYYQGYCVLVHKRHETELYRLSDGDRRQYFDEMCLLAGAIADCCGPVKMNYELLGNQVPHLHWHLFPRYPDDPDRLQPVWLALAGAEADAGTRARLETGRLGRAETAHRLRETLAKRTAEAK